MAKGTWLSVGEAPLLVDWLKLAQQPSKMVGIGVLLHTCVGRCCDAEPLFCVLRRQVKGQSLLQVFFRVKHTLLAIAKHKADFEVIGLIEQEGATGRRFVGTHVTLSTHT